MLGMHAIMRAGGNFDPLALPSLLFFNSYDTMTPTNSITANDTTHGPFPGRRLTFTAPSNLACNLSSAGLVSAYAGGSAIFAGYTNAANNGNWDINNAGLSSITVTNAAGVSEPTGAGAATVPTATVDILGMCSAYTDLKGGYSFVQATLANMFSANGAIISGKKVLGVQASLSRTLVCQSIPLAGQLNGTQAFTMFTYFRPTVVNNSGTVTQWMMFHDAGLANVCRCNYGAATNGTVTTVGGGAANSTTQAGVLSTPIALNTWQLLCVTHTGTTATWFLDGVQVATQTSGVQRTRTNMDRVTLATQGTFGYRAVDGAMAGLMTTAQMVALKAWCQAKYA